MRKVFIKLVRGYQVLVSPFIGQNCKFYPSCSSYAIESLERYGIIKGSCLACYRIIRCNPFCSGGFDPVEKSEK